MAGKLYAFLLGDRGDGSLTAEQALSQAQQTLNIVFDTCLRRADAFLNLESDLVEQRGIELTKEEVWELVEVFAASTTSTSVP